MLLGLAGNNKAENRAVFLSSWKVDFLEICGSQWTEQHNKHVNFIDHDALPQIKQVKGCKVVQISSTLAVRCNIHINTAEILNQKLHEYDLDQNTSSTSAYIICVSLMLSSLEPADK